MITKHGKPVAALIPYEDWKKLTAIEGRRIGFGPPSRGGWLDAEIDGMVDEIYEARTKSRSRTPAL